MVLVGSKSRLATASAAPCVSRRFAPSAIGLTASNCFPRRVNMPPAEETLLIDNYDSFTFNLYQYLSTLGAKVRVVRNSDLKPQDLPSLNIRNLIISPGPGHPKTDGGISQAAIKYFSGKVPILGVCMGLECLVDALGGDISYAGEIMHGKTSKIRHDERGCFQGIPQGFQSIRYHSLSAHIKTIPDQLAICAFTEESGVVMAVRHREYTVEAVQYHPESILSEYGTEYLKNFLSLRGGTWEENPSFGVLDSQLPPFKYEPSGIPMATKLPSILDTIQKQRLEDINVAQRTPGTTTEDLQAALDLHLDPPLISLVRRLSQGPGPALMAEIKRASPSKGDISMGTRAPTQALKYALAGASVISVLTEPKWFKGSLLDMRLARQAVESIPNRPAILRKDFILDEYQIMEARIHGADTVLLIVAMLPTSRLAALMKYSRSLGMEPLVEVNNADEMASALELGAEVIGVNNRNLHTFQVDMKTTTRLADMCKEKNVILCALSGINSRKDVVDYLGQGVKAILVGEALMRASDPHLFIQELLDLPPTVPNKVQKPLVKICGIGSAEDALVAAEAGADFIGLIFAEKSKRKVSIKTAVEIATVVQTYRDEAEIPHPQSIDHPVPWFAFHAQTVQPLRKPLLVGVFQDQPLEDILALVSALKLDFVQLHGIEPLQMASYIPVPVIRVIHVKHDDTAETLKSISRPGLHQHLLLEAVKRGETVSGGSGTTIDLDLANELIEQGEAGGSPRLQLILAGGLNPENVAKIVKTVKPWAVDVSSGVETEGKKDAQKIRKFIEAAKSVSF
jgi:anthranilate synthase/indole-3-glycerol phosphate synthase/phosphoribosylanthranilate isomerase